MNPQLVEFALRKQRLQIRADMQRLDMARRMEGITPLFDAVDRVRDGARWTRDNAPVIASVALGVALLKPRIAWRLGRRAWRGLAFVRRVHRGIAPLLALVASAGIAARRS